MLLPSRGVSLHRDVLFGLLVGKWSSQICSLAEVEFVQNVFHWGLVWHLLDHFWSCLLNPLRHKPSLIMWCDIVYICSTWAMIV